MTDQRDDAAFEDWAAFEAWFEKHWSTLLYKPKVRTRIRQDAAYGWHAALAWERERTQERLEGADAELYQRIGRMVAKFKMVTGDRPRVIQLSRDLEPLLPAGTRSLFGVPCEFVDDAPRNHVYVLGESGGHAESVSDAD